MENRICKLFDINYPIIQAGMVWCSGWRLASAVSNAGGLGLIGSGSMNALLLRDHIVKCKANTNKPFGVNIPLLYKDTEEKIKVIIEEEVKFVFTSGGNPDLWTKTLQNEGVVVVHVVSSLKFALKAQDAGVDAVVGEGFEAGGHNGRDETTTFCLIPHLRGSLQIPVIAAGGIYSGRTMAAAFCLGAEGVQVGTRFVSCTESSAHELFKKKVLDLQEGETQLVLKKLTPVRIIKNQFYNSVKQAEDLGADIETLKNILGKGRAKLGMFEGNIDEGELEIGQVASLIKKEECAGDIVQEIWREYIGTSKEISAKLG